MKKQPVRAVREQIYARWTARPPNERCSDNTIPFVDEMWEAGLRLAIHPATHYQHVMDVIRSRIKDDV